ncbi:hypothetical protein EV651_11175 [Kribbella sp. VKM Ac-2571]|nr:hypothetical protein EV651_11175 [Kribbella sp. VKM Ac-2571]
MVERVEFADQGLKLWPLMDRGKPLDTQLTADRKSAAGKFDWSGELLNGSYDRCEANYSTPVTRGIPEAAACHIDV